MSQRIKTEELIALCILLTYISCSYDVYTTCNVHDQSYYVKNIAETQIIYIFILFCQLLECNHYWNLITSTLHVLNREG